MALRAGSAMARLELGIRFYMFIRCNLFGIKNVWCLENVNQDFCSKIKKKSYNLVLGFFWFDVWYYHNHQTTISLNLQT
jgi:hypothetical protein